MSTNATGTELTALIKRAMRGNTQAFEQLVNAFSEDIYYNALMCLDERCKADADDVAQDVVVVLYRNIRKLKSPRAFYSYMRSVIYNMAQRYNLKAKRTSTEDVDEHEQAGHLRVPASEQPEEEFYRKQATTLLAGYMEQLPAKQREALYLYYYRDLSYAEIAERLNITTSTVGTNISKAKGALKKMLEESERTQLQTPDTSTFLSEESRPSSVPEADEDTFAGFAAAPLIHDAVNQTMNHYAVQEHARTLATHAHTVVSAHPEVAAAGIAVVAPKLLKAAGAVIVAAGVAVGSFFGIQELNSCVHPSSETTVITTVSEYNPQAEILFAGAPQDKEVSDEIPAVGSEESEVANNEGTEEHNGEGAGAAEVDAQQTMDGNPEAVVDHINPASATVTLSEGTVGAWQIVTTTGDKVREGAAAPADLTVLEQGDYTIVFDLISPDGSIHASVQRDFVVQ